MKKLTLLAVAIAAASGVQAAEVYKNGDVSLDVGGRAEARVTFKNDEAKGDDGRAVTDDSRARLNFNAKNQLSDKYYVRGFFETEYTPKNDKDGNSIIDTRHVYAAFGDDNNELRYGKTDGSLGLVTDFTDIFYSYGGEAQAKLKTADRAENQLLYIGTFDGLTIKANANGGGSKYALDKSGIKVDADIRYGLGLAAKYDIGAGFSVAAGAAYEDINNGSISKVGGKPFAASGLKANSSEYVGGLGYTLDALYLGAGINYTTTTLKDTGSNGDVKASSTGWELVGKYKFTDKWQGIAGYSNTSYDSTPSTDIDNDSFASAELAYSWTPAVVTYAGIEYGLSGVEHDDSLAGRVGAKVTF